MERAHGIMFHHFHNGKHYKGQGSIDAEAFALIIRQYKDRLLPADEWYEKAVSGNLMPQDLCITFDDALLCQYDIATPVLKDAGITAFWFINTSVLEGEKEKLEVYRKFRHVCFESIDDFYERFFSAAFASAWGEKIENGLQNYSHDLYAKYPFYTPNDTKFRYIRNYLLDDHSYESIMDTLIQEAGVSLEEMAKDLWMNEKHIVDLHRKGHIIGLHSHTHPVNIAGLPSRIQRKEYTANHKTLTRLLKSPPKTVAHPADSYNPTTLTILKELGITMGFEATMHPKTASPLTLPREDHVTVLNRITQKRVS